MNKKNSYSDNDPIILKKHLRQVNRQEKYYFYEKDKGKLVRFDDAYITDRNVSIEESIIKQHKLIALRKSLEELTALEQEMIDDCFFTNKKVSYTKLSQKYNISRQAYKKRLDKVLMKLRVLIDDYYEKHYDGF